MIGFSAAILNSASLLHWFLLGTGYFISISTFWGIAHFAYLYKETMQLAHIAGSE